jgi:WD40 repeat protein
VVDLKFTHAGSLLISSGWDGARIWDPIRGTHVLTLPGGSVGLRPDDRQVVLRDQDSGFGIWELADGRECRALHHGMVGNRTPRPVDWGPNAVDFSSDGRLLASSENDGVRLWDTSTGTPVVHMPVGGVGTLQFSPEGSHLRTQLFTGANIWPLRKTSDGADGGLRIGPPQFLGTMRGLGLSTRDRTGPYVTLTDLARSQAVVLDPADSAEVARLGPHSGLNQCSISPDGRWLATATWKGKDVKVWEVATGRLAWQLPCDSAYVNFSPDGRWLAVAKFPGLECLLWHVGSWEPGPAIRVGASFYVMAFSRDGRLLAIDDAGRVRLVDPESGREVATLDAGTGSSTSFFCLAISPDGNFLAAGRDHIIHLWDLRHIRGQLAAMGLDWDAPPIPAAEAAPASIPIRVRVEGADWLTAAATGDDEARAGQWAAAEAAHARAVAEGAEDPLIWQRHLLFRLRAGDMSGYRDGCAALISRFQGEQRPGFLEPLAWACSLGPDALVDWTSLIAAMEASVKQWPHDAEMRKTLGAALVRAGRPRQAISDLEESVRLNGHGGNAFDWLFLALAHHRLGDPKRATAALAAARDWIAHGDARAKPDPYLWSPLRWYTKLELELLLREAERKITGASVDLPSVHGHANRDEGARVLLAGSGG